MIRFHALISILGRSAATEVLLKQGCYGGGILSCGCHDGAPLSAVER